MMMQSYFNSIIYLLLLYLICTASCNNQISESATPSKLTTIEKISETSPRVDSVLQFSVMVTDIFEDSKGNFWFGSHGDGLCRYDGKQYTYFTANHGLPNGVVRNIAPGLDWDKTRDINGGNQIGSIQEDQNGNIWVKSSEHISKFDGQNFISIPTDSESILLMNKSTEEWKDELDDLWFGSGNLGLYHYDGNQLEYLAFPPSYTSDRDGVSEVYKDNDGNMWLGTMENGTFRYDGKSFTRINKDDEIGVCRSVFQDNTGKVWITNNRFGLNYLEDGKLTNFIEEYRLKNPSDDISEEFGTSFQSIGQDENGDLWFGTFGSGLWSYDGEKLFHYTNVDSLSVLLVKSIYKDNKGKLWFGIGEGTVYGFNGKSFDRFDAMN